uniref:Transmembrane protein n=1 Tax=Chromera velia CCMP2878 TaxID=1169474 RepID=A0A0G4HJV0_9ALVE|eukprot:Cvel_28380.t1-p1 / transcript=Cvel_28380.t1 / gene=Cvel_28380 / organism=Chromera_velia_CCMP2878 / gene_product=hypothetical protein / transcript_product=hypothetical protein / location=Cvel_scaffold3703:9199-14027(-) / protein_length=905 / sequence_SO=supercontig / SO=protein_coding / is_pseudo=false
MRRSVSAEILGKEPCRLQAQGNERRTETGDGHTSDTEVQRGLRRGSTEVFLRNFTLLEEEEEESQQSQQTDEATGRAGPDQQADPIPSTDVLPVFILRANAATATAGHQGAWLTPGMRSAGPSTRRQLLGAPAPEFSSIVVGDTAVVRGGVRTAGGRKSRAVANSVRVAVREGSTWIFSSEGPAVLILREAAFGWAVSAVWHLLITVAEEIRERRRVERERRELETWIEEEGVSRGMSTWTTRSLLPRRNLSGGSFGGGSFSRLNVKGARRALVFVARAAMRDALWAGSLTGLWWGLELLEECGGKFALFGLEVVLPSCVMTAVQGLHRRFWVAVAAGVPGLHWLAGVPKTIKGDRRCPDFLTDSICHLLSALVGIGMLSMGTGGAVAGLLFSFVDALTDLTPWIAVWVSRFLKRLLCIGERGRVHSRGEEEEEEETGVIKHTPHRHQTPISLPPGAELPLRSNETVSSPLLHTHAPSASLRFLTPSLANAGRAVSSSSLLPHTHRHPHGVTPRPRPRPRLRRHISFSLFDSPRHTQRTPASAAPRHPTRSRWRVAAVEPTEWALEALGDAATAAVTAGDGETERGGATGATTFRRPRTKSSGLLSQRRKSGASVPDSATAAAATSSSVPLSRLDSRVLSDGTTQVIPSGGCPPAPPKEKEVTRRNRRDAQRRPSIVPPSGRQRGPRLPTLSVSFQDPRPESPPPPEAPADTHTCGESREQGPDLSAVVSVPPLVRSRRHPASATDTCMTSLSERKGGNLLTPSRFGSSAFPESCDDETAEDRKEKETRRTLMRLSGGSGGDSIGSLVPSLQQAAVYGDSGPSDDSSSVQEEGDRQDIQIVENRGVDVRRDRKGGDHQFLLDSDRGGRASSSWPKRDEAFYDGREEQEQILKPSDFWYTIDRLGL